MRESLLTAAANWLMVYKKLHYQRAPPPLLLTGARCLYVHFAKQPDNSPRRNSHREAIRDGTQKQNTQINAPLNLFAWSSGNAHPGYRRPPDRNRRNPEIISKFIIKRSNKNTKWSMQNLEFICDAVNSFTFTTRKTLIAR